MKTFTKIQKEIISHLKSSARSAQGLLYSIGLVVTLLLAGTEDVWGATDTSEFTSSAFAGLSASWSKSSSGTLRYDDTRGVQHQKSATTTFTATGFTNVTKVQVWVAKSSSGTGSVKIQENNTAKKTISSFNATLTEQSYEWATPYTGTLKIVVNATKSSIYIKKIVVTTSSGAKTLTLKLPKGDGTFEDYETTDKSKLADYDLMVSKKACYGSAAFWGGSWNSGYWTDEFIDYGAATTTQPTRYSSSSTFSTNKTLWPLFVYGSTPTYYHTDPYCPTYHVYYDGNEKTSGTVPSDATDYDGGETVTVKSATLTRTNYTFTGWNTEPDGSGTHYAASGSATLTITEDVTLYAEWCRDLTTLTSSEFDLEASSITGTSARIDWLATGATKYSVRIADNSTWASATYQYSADNVTSTDVTRTDLTPATKYWVSIQAKNDCGTTTKQKTITFTTLAAYVITYYKNDGSATSATESKTEGVNYTISSDKFSRDGYTLTKWNTQAGGGGTDYAKGATYSADAALELYAVWTANNYTITLNGNGGSGNPATVSATYGAAAPSVGTLPTKADKNFAGYWTGEGGTGTMVVDASGVWVASISGYTDASKNWIGTEGKTIYAKWVDKTYTNYRTTCGAPRTLDHIAITTNPTKLNYLVGETVNTAGAVVTAHYTDDTSSDVTASVTWTAPSGALSAGLNQNLTASYTLGGVTKTATNAVINVYAVTLLKKDETGATISGELSDAPAVSLTSVNHLTAAETGAKYTFKEWQVTGGSLSSTSSLTPTIDAVSGAITVTAVYYKPITVTWHVPSGVFSGPSNYSRGWETQFPDPSPDPEDYGCDGKIFYGWTRSSSYNDDDTPPALVTSGEVLTGNEDFYAVFAIQEGAGTPPTWTVTSFGSVTAGTYLIALRNKKVFNGEISSGHGQVTNAAFSQELSGSFSEAAPVGACELTLSANSSGWNMYNADLGYLYCKGSSSGNLAWNLSAQDYWFSNSSSWRYHGAKNSSGVYVALSDYSTSVRTYTSPTNIVLLKKTAAGSPATYSEFSTSCTCKGFSFHTGSGTDDEVKTTNTRTCFEQVDASTTWKIDDYVIPSDAKFFVGWQDEFKSSGLGTSSRSAVTQFNADEALYFEYTKTYGDGYRPSVGNAVGAIGTLRIWSDNSWNNCHVGFDPNGYIFKLGSTYYTMSNSTTLDGARYKETEVITLTSTDISGKYQVNIAAVAPNASTGVASRYTENKNLAGMGVKNGASTWRGEGIKASDANTKGFFRIDKGEGGATNWNAHWVPCYELTFDLKGGTGTIVTTPAYVSVEAASKVVTIPTTAPTKDGYRFMGWSNTDGGAVNYTAGTTHNVTLSGNKTVYAVWAQEYTVTYDANGGTTSCSEPTHIAGETVTVCATEPTRDCSTFSGWLGDNGIGPKAASATFTMPAANVTLTAQWNTTQYAITYKDQGDVTYTGSNIGSLPANHTCGSATVLPNGVKEGYRFDGWFTTSACTGEPITSIASDAVGSFTLYAKWTAAYTFTFSKNGIVDGTLTLGQVEGGNVIMPNTTVDCGLWTTFEGWVLGDVTETTTEPAMIYKPGDIFVAGNSNQEFKAVYSKHEGDASVYYEKVTSGPKSGTYIMVSSEVASNKYVYTGQNSGSGTTDYGTVTTVTESDGVVTSANLPNGAKEITVRVGRGGSINNKFAMQIPSTKYLSATSGNYLNSDIASGNVDDAYVWKILDGNTKVNNKDRNPAAGAIHSTTKTTRVIQYVSTSGGRFACYENTQSNDVFLYRKRVAGTTYYTTAPGSCDVPTEITVSYSDNKAYAGDQTISGMPSGTTLTFTSYPNFASYTIGAAPTDPTGYHFAGWNTSADGGGDAYTAGSSVTTFGYTETITLYAQWERVYTVTFNDQGVQTPVTQASAGASVAVPSNPTPCNTKPGVTWTFVGWGSQDGLVQSLNGHIVIPEGTSTYTPSDDITLYAVYRKSTGTSDAFAVGTSGAYTIGAKQGAAYAECLATAKYGAGYNCKNDGSEPATIFYLNYINSGEHIGQYTMQDGNTGEYVCYSGNSTGLSWSSTTPYYYNVVANGTGWNLQFSTATGRYFTHETGSTAYSFKAYQSTNPVTLHPAAASTYYTVASCDDDFNITFVANGSEITWQVNHGEGTYYHLADGTEISVFPTASFDGWTFLGWRTADYDESTKAPEALTIYGGSDGTSGNHYVIHSSITMYPVFTRFEDNEPFDQINGGDYYIYFLESGSDDGYGAEKRVYAATHDGIRYNSTAVCDNATTFTFTKLDNGNWTIYDNTTKKYLYGVADDDLRQKASATGAEWTLTVNGNQFDAFHVGTSYGQITASGNGTSATFMNYSRDNLKSNPGLYHRVYLGSCTNRTFTTNPSTTPNIEIHGQVKVTSTAGKSIKSTSVLTVSASNIATANLTVTSNNGAFKISLTSNGAYSESVNIPVVSNKVGVTPIYVEYTPSATEDGIEEATITVSDGASPTPTEVSTESGDVQGRHVPANFVIAAKWGNKWYALPANCTESTSSTTGVLIEVDNASDPTRAIAAPSYTKWGLQTVRPSRKAEYGSRLVFTEQLTTATADNQKTLYNGSTTSIQANAMYQYYLGDATEKYEWIPTTTDLKDYVLTSATTLSGDASARTVSLSNKGVFGTLLNNKAYDGKVRLLPATFVEPAEIQVVEWKASSVVVMYTGSGTKAITQLGDDAPSSAQSLSSAKVDHGVFELTTGTLTSAKNEPLNITIQNGSDAIVGRKSLVVPAIVSGSQNAPLGLETDETKLTDVVILDGATLSAVATKYTFKNITVYPGGKLVIGSGKQLGMASLTLRGGSSWGAATYEHKYPQFVVNNATSGAYSNSSAVINYDYVTTKDQYYSFVLPYNGSTSAIKYPLDIYGSAVSASNTGSFEFQYYDGAARAAGGTGWNVLAEPATLVAGTGYTFLGMPKKVDAYDGTDDSHANSRQRYGIHRIPMSVAANVVQAGETNSDPGKATPIRVTLASKNNNSGWALVGNPYLSNVSGLNNQDIQVGKLVHTDTNPWDGKWQWDNPTTGVRYIVLTDDGQNFESQQASTATLKAFKNFFVQIQNGEATSLVIPANTRTDKDLAPARYMADVEQDIQLAVDLVSETRSDKVDLLINDIYTAEFDQDGDFTKMMNTTNFNLYGVYPGDNLSFIAVDKTTAAGSIAIGYQVPAAGEYTLQLSERPYVMSDYVETLLVTDHEVSPEVTTDLLENPYSFTVTKAETNDARFTVSIKLKENQDTPTDIDIINGGGDLDGEKPIKFIYHDKMYILRNGVLYDATGKKVREIK